MAPPESQESAEGDWELFSEHRSDRACHVIGTLYPHAAVFITGLQKEGFGPPFSERKGRLRAVHDRT